jgi:hypothetical protein
LEIRHGAIASLRSTPVGWELKINNYPSWNTKIGGHALVGAAFLQLAELPDLISVIPEPHYTCSQLDQPGLLRLKLQLYENDQMRNLSVGHLSVVD